MPEYAPTPRLEGANPIQRYLHKGSLEPRDWFRLAVLVIAYILLRPQIEWLMKKYFDADPFRTSQDARKEAKLKAKISPNTIRGAGEKAEDGSAASSSATASGTDANGEEEITLRRGKGGSEFTATTLQQQLLDWDDIQALPALEVGKGDVGDWVKKWDGDA